jgi:hypothetical protein
LIAACCDDPLVAHEPASTNTKKKLRMLKWTSQKMGTTYCGKNFNANLLRTATHSARAVLVCGVVRLGHITECVRVGN